MKRDKVITKKVILCGYRAPGKSTILRMVTEGKILSRDEISDPGTATIDYARRQQMVDDIDITFFDLGGNTAFLDRFTGELSEFIFRGVATLVYVVDSIEMRDFSRVKYYLDRCMERIDQYSPEAAVAEATFGIVANSVTLACISFSIVG